MCKVNLEFIHGLEPRSVKVVTMYEDGYLMVVAAQESAHRLLATSTWVRCSQDLENHNSTHACELTRAFDEVLVKTSGDVGVFLRTRYNLSGSPI